MRPGSHLQDDLGGRGPAGVDIREGGGAVRQRTALEPAQPAKPTFRQGLRRRPDRGIDRAKASMACRSTISKRKLATIDTAAAAIGPSLKGGGAP